MHRRAVHVLPRTVYTRAGVKWRRARVCAVRAAAARAGSPAPKRARLRGHTTNLDGPSHPLGHERTAISLAPGMTAVARRGAAAAAVP